MLRQEHSMDNHNVVELQLCPHCLIVNFFQDGRRSWSWHDFGDWKPSPGREEGNDEMSCGSCHRDYHDIYEQCSLNIMATIIIWLPRLPRSPQIMIRIKNIIHHTLRPTCMTKPEYTLLNIFKTKPLGTRACATWNHPDAFCDRELEDLVDRSGER